MSVGGTPTGFNISDFLTRVIPGGILIFSIGFPIVSFESLPIDSISGSSVLIFGIASFVFGEFINTFRISMLDVPNYFCRVLYAENEDEIYLGMTDSIFRKFDSDSIKGYSLFEHSDTDIVSTLRSRFDLDGDFDGAHNFYTLLTSDLSSEKSEETSRLENIYIFYANVKMSVLLSILVAMLYTGLILVGVIEQTPLRTALGILIVYLLFCLFYLLILSFKLIAPTDRVYVESLLSDYFTYVKKED